ncbi:MAG TPA: glycoside hydrolase family 3 N-terminal domain-containing protein [Ktedonobacteraceae bacterium]|jgi:beta-N-acetylhexosaminidase|nr:glycoside hydrolase family 3 N-terminal domain-containing protein [Ktedonobacteraceae bacterium]
MDSISPDFYEEVDEEQEDTLQVPVVPDNHATGPIEAEQKQDEGEKEARNELNVREQDKNEDGAKENQRSSPAIAHPLAKADAPEAALHKTATAQLSPRAKISRGKALIVMALLFIVVFQAINAGYAQFLGSQGWGIVLGGPASNGKNDIIAAVKAKLRTPGANGTATTHITPQQFINEIIQNMTLDQKLGQMMIVQFLGPTYSLDISTMISQEDVGAVLLFTANDNIQSKTQLTGLIQQMQSNSTTLPLAVAIDQEGGTVDRLASLDGPRPSAAEIGATNDPNKARQEGIRDAQDLASYGFNMNLAPVVDVNNVYNAQLYDRTFGNNPDIVTRMAEAYLQGLEKSGKVIGTLKHFPGLGDVSTDPHLGLPVLKRTKSQLENIDWAPYRSLIAQGDVYSVMVTHEMVPAIDSSTISSLSPKIVTGILRDDLGFQGVVMTDSLTMEGVAALYSEQESAALAVEAGCDLLMGASTPRDVAMMIEGIKQAMNSGAITMQRIDDSVRRILMMKYEMGLLPIPAN